MIKETDTSQCQSARSHNPNKTGNLATPRSQRNADTQKLKGFDDDLGMVNASIALMKKAKDEAKLKVEQKFIEINKSVKSIVKKLTFTGNWSQQKILCKPKPKKSTRHSQQPKLSSRLILKKFPVRLSSNILKSCFFSIKNSKELIKNVMNLKKL